MRITYLVSLFWWISLLQTRPLCAQESPAHKGNGHFLVQLAYNKGLGSIWIDKNLKAPNRGTLYSLKLSYIRASLSGRFLYGCGIGSEGYHDPSFNLLPIFASGRYFFSQMYPKWFVGAELGYAVKISEQHSSGGVSNISFGYHLNPHRKVSMLLAAGFHLHQIRDAQTLVFNPVDNTLDYVQSTFWLKSTSVSVAFVF